jgi:hypothetical protein
MIPGYLSSKMTRDLMTKQEITGIYFDTDKARELVAYAQEEMEKIEQEIEPELPPRP